MIGETEHKSDNLLVHCPFCYSTDLVIVVQQVAGVPEMDDVCFVRCRNCGAQGPTVHTMIERLLHLTNTEK